MPYCLNFPGKILFGSGVINQIAGLLNDNKRILVVIGKHGLSDGTSTRISSLLQSCDVSFFSGVNGEPSLEDVDRIIAECRNFSATAIIAIGGGSIIDAAKTAAALVNVDGTTADYFFERKKIKSKGLFFIAAPTTAGTGAELTPNAVLTDSNSLIKKSIKHPTMFADVAIIDPELSYSCPKSLTAWSGMDSLTQAIESYLSIDANTFTRLLAGKAAALILKNLPIAYFNPDINSRTAMSEATMLGALAFSQSGLGAVHGLAHPIGSKLKLPHGLTCAIILPVILKWNLAECEENMNILAEYCGFNSALSLISAIESLNQQLLIPDSFSSFGLNNTIFDFIIDNCRSGSMQKNPRKLSDTQILTILGELC
jgi:alcohol dehydrogenase class IV